MTKGGSLSVNQESVVAFTDNSVMVEDKSKKYIEDVKELPPSLRVIYLRRNP